MVSVLFETITLKEYAFIVPKSFIVALTAGIPLNVYWLNIEKLATFLSEETIEFANVNLNGDSVKLVCTLGLSVRFR